MPTFSGSCATSFVLGTDELIEKGMTEGLTDDLGRLRTLARLSLPVNYAHLIKNVFCGITRMIKPIAFCNELIVIV